MPDDVLNWKLRWGTGAALVDTLEPRRTNPLDIQLPGKRRAMDDSALDYKRHGGVEDILAKPFAQSVLGRRRDREAIDRTAAADQITGVAYTAQRQSELAKTIKNEKHYLVAEYGLRTITDLTPVGQRDGLRIDSQMSSPYMRDELDVRGIPGKPVESGFKALYAKKKGSGLPEFDPNKVFFVNSAKTLEKLTAVGGAEWAAPDGTKILEGGRTARAEKVLDGFYALVVDPPFGGSETDKTKLAALTGNLLPGTGSTPSTHMLVKNLADPPATDPLTDSTLLDGTVDNVKTLEGLGKAPSLKSLAGLPADHPMKTIAGATTKMVEGLVKALGAKPDNKEALKQNVLIAEALKNVEQLVETMPSYMDDIPRFSRLFDVMVDEVYLALAVAKPYGIGDFKGAATKSVQERALTLQSLDTSSGVKTESFLVSSGMDTLASATLAAKFALAGRGNAINLMESMTKENRKTRGTNYFEVQTNMLGEQALSASGPLIMGTLNPSTPTQQMKIGAEKEWSVDDLIAGIRERIKPSDPTAEAATPEKPSVAVIDVTVEKGSEKELEKIVKAFEAEIAAGSLQLVLCKSYQKFPSLGSGKAMAGGVTVIGKGEAADKLKESLAATQDAEGVMNNDEAQLVTHFVTHEEGMERPMLARAAKNAETVRGMLGSPGGEKFMHAKDLPFVAIPEQEVTFKSGGATSAINPGELLQRVGVENRFSFGFQNSSCLPFPGGVRIAAGQESTGELAEKFYAPLALIEENKGPVDPASLKKIAAEAGDDAGNHVRNHLAKGASGEPAKNADWRMMTVRQLLDAGALKQEAVEFSTTTKDVSRVLGADEAGKIDTMLHAILDSLAGEEPPEGFDLPEERRLAVQMALLAQNTGVHIEEESGTRDDADVLHASVQRGWPKEGGGVEEQPFMTANLPNIIASCALTTDALFKDKEGADAFKALADPLIESGLDRLSPEARQKIVRKRAECELLSGCGDLGKPGAVESASARVRGLVDKLPYREGGANMLKGEVFPNLMGGWGEAIKAKRAEAAPKPGEGAVSTEMQEERKRAEEEAKALETAAAAATDKLVAATTSGLDLRSKIDLLTSLLDTVKALADEDEAAARVKVEIDNLKKDIETKKGERASLDVPTNDWEVGFKKALGIGGTIKALDAKKTLGQLKGKASKLDPTEIGSGTDKTTVSKAAIEEMLKFVATCEDAKVREQAELAEQLRTKEQTLPGEVATAQTKAALATRKQLAVALAVQVRADLDKVLKAYKTAKKDRDAAITLERPLKTVKLGGIPVQGDKAPATASESDLKELDELLKKAEARVL